MRPDGIFRDDNDALKWVQNSPGIVINVLRALQNIYSKFVFLVSFGVWKVKRDLKDIERLKYIRTLRARLPPSAVNIRIFEFRCLQMDYKHKKKTVGNVVSELKWKNGDDWFCWRVSAPIAFDKHPEGR